MIISICGTNGSGKTTVVREIMRNAQRCVPLYGVLGVRKPEAYRLEMPEAPQPAFVLGPYDTASACGFDGVTNYEHQPVLVKTYAARGSVVFEGLISGKLWGRVGAVLEELAPHQGVLRLYLTTPIDECVQRVAARRQEAGDRRPFNEKNLRAVYGQVQSNLKSIRKKDIPGLQIEELPSDQAAARCLELLRSA